VKTWIKERYKGRNGERDIKVERFLPLACLNNN
jgi:hypothetical protein